MANTYVQIGSTVTVGAGGAASMDFSSIPATYTDLCLKISSRSSNASAYVAIRVRYNGSASSYIGRQLYGDGAGAVSNTYSDGWSGFMNAANSTTNTFSSTEIYIPNYASSNNKSSSVDFAQESNAATAITGMLARVWDNTAAITSIAITPEIGNFVQYSTATLYGIKNS
jgi:hypothetical protein